MPENNQKYIRCVQLTQDAFLYDLYISFSVQYIYPPGPRPPLPAKDRKQSLH